MFAQMMAAASGGSGAVSGTSAPAAVGQPLEIDTGLNEINGFILWRFDTSYPSRQSALRYEKIDIGKFYTLTSQAEGQAAYTSFTSTADARKYMVKQVNLGKITIIMPNNASYNSGMLYWWAW